jgi:electron transfer flavoprotein alpha subunit
MAGCGNARNIVAINTDAEAAIYKDARWGVVGDYRKVIPSLVAAVRKLRAAEREENA